MSEKDYYRVLGVSRDALLIEIRREYRRLALLYHPDRNSDPKHEARFREISEAYATLSEPKTRAIYDGQEFHRPVENPLKATQGIWRGWFSEQLKGEGYDPS